MCFIHSFKTHVYVKISSRKAKFPQKLKANNEGENVYDLFGRESTKGTLYTAAHGTIPEQN